MIVERMKKFVFDYDHDMPYWSGYRFKKAFGTYVPESYRNRVGLL